MVGNQCRLNPTLIALTAAPVLLGVAVQKLPPESPQRGTYPVVKVSHRREVTNDEYNVAC